MSEQWVGPGWWYASDGKWYPPLDGDPSSEHVPESSSDSGDGDDVVGVGDGAVALDLTENGPLGRERRVSSTADTHDAEQAPTEARTAQARTAQARTAQARDVGRLAEPVPFSVAPPKDVEILDLAAFDNAPRQQEQPKVVAAIVASGSDLEIGGTGVTSNSTGATSNSTGETDLTTSPEQPNASSRSKAAAFLNRTEVDRPKSVTRTSIRDDDTVAAKAPRVGTPGRVEQATAEAADLRPDDDPARQHRSGDASLDPNGKNGHDDNTFWDGDHDGSPRRRETPLFVAAVGLAILSGVLGALWLRERAAVNDLRSESEAAQQLATDVDIEDLERQLNTLRLQNDQLEQQLTDMSALVLELPEGRVIEIDVPLTPVLADEENGRLIAIDENGDYVVFGDGVENPITDSGSVGAAPTGLFAASARAWVSTEAGIIDILPLRPQTEVQDDVSYGPVMFLAAETRGYWTYDPGQGQVVRLRKGDGMVTDVVDIPVEVVDLTIGAGSVWALGDDGGVYRINTADLTIQQLDAGEEVISITAGPDALWTLSAADGSLRRIDPVTGAVLVTVPVGRDPIDAIFAGSSVWVALRSGSSLIEVDTRTSAVVSRTELPSQPTALHQGDTGVFVTIDSDDAPLLRIDSLSQTPDAAEQAAEAASDAEAVTSDDS